MIPLTKPWFTNDELDAVKKVLDSGYVTEGPTAKQFGEEVREYINAGFCTTTTSCTIALYVAAKSLGIGKGDDVIVPSFTYPATQFIVENVGANVVFCDVDERMYNTTRELLEEKLTPKTKAILPVHEFGLSAPMEDIMKFAQDNDLKVIEDAACALGAKWGSKFTGTWGDFGCFAFHARKVITTGEGGIIATNDEGLMKKAELWKRFGYDGKRDFSLPGMNFKFSDILAAVGLAQMRKIDRLIDKRRSIAQAYNKLIKEKLGKTVQTPIEPKGAFHIYQTYVVTLDDSIDRDKVIEEMAKLGVQAQIGTYAVHQCSFYKKRKEDLPVSTRLYKQCLALPSYFTMTDAEIKTVVDSLEKAVKACTRR